MTPSADKDTIRDLLASRGEDAPRPVRARYGTCGGGVLVAKVLFAHDGVAALRAQLVAFDERLAEHGGLAESARIVEKVRAALAICDRELAERSRWRHEAHELSAELDAATTAVLEQAEFEWETSGFRIGRFPDPQLPLPPGPRPEFRPGR